jgi:putative oxidoreductase
MNVLCEKSKRLVEFLKDLPPLFFRLTLAYGFYGPAVKKLSNIDGIAEWFATLKMFDLFNIPFPTLNAYMAAGTEGLGVLLLTLGLATRLISIPMMFVMFVAIGTVHWKNGFSAGDNGFEIPFYYFLMLFSLLITGAGKFSLDALLAKKYCSDK